MTSASDTRRTLQATGRRGGLALPLSGILLAQFVASLSATIVATALPSIYADLHTPAAASTWIVAATVLGNAVSVPIWGGIADRVRPKTVLQSAVLLFGVASFVAGTASGTAVLIAGRALQGVALGGLFSLGAVVVAGLTTPRQRGRVNAWTATAQTVATVIGPTLGGLVVQSDHLGWRWCFFLGLPVTVTAVVLIGLTIQRGAIAADRPQRDVLGAVLVGTAVTLLLVAVSLSADAGRAVWWIVGTGGAGVVAAVATVLVELRVPAPVLPVRLLRDPVVGRCAAGAFLTGTGLFSGTVFVSQFLQTGAGLSPTASGLVLLPGALVAVSVSFAAGRYMGRTGRVRPVLAVAAGLLVTGHTSLAVAGFAPVPATIVGTIAIASGVILTTQNWVLAAQNAVADRGVGAVTALVQLGVVIGGAVALVAYGAVLHGVVAAFGAVDLASGAAWTLAMGITFGAAAVVGLPVLLIVHRMPPQRLAARAEERP